MRIHHRRTMVAAAAAMSAALLGAAPAAGQDRSCDQGRGSLVTDIGFRLAPTRDGAPIALIDFVRPGGPADGQVLAGDRLLKVEGRVYASARDADAALKTWPAGRPIVLRLIRDGREIESSIVAVERCAAFPPPPPLAPDAPPPPTPESPPNPPSDELIDSRLLGFRVDCDDCGDDAEGRFRFNVAPRVSEVLEGGEAARAGVRAGDRLLAINGVAMTDPVAMERVRWLRSGEAVILTLERAGSAFEAAVIVR